MDAALDALEAAVSPYLAGPLKEVAKHLTPLENARLQASLVFVSTSLAFGASLTTAGAAAAALGC